MNSFWSRNGVRFAAHLICALPLCWLVYAALTDGLGANPIEAVIRSLGDWALRGLVVALAVTPLRRLGWRRVASYRRMTGLWAFAYAALHLAAYVGLDQFFDWTAIFGDIVKHKFITAGMASFALLLPLAVTSTRAAIRRMGGRAWIILHRAVYPAALLAALHYVWMVKADLHQPILYGSLLILLLASRLIQTKGA